MVVDGNGKLLEPTVTYECSWCDTVYWVCSYGALQIKAGALANLCGHHHAEFMGKRIGDFGPVRIYRADQERDVDANGWLSNALRLLEEPEDR
jgi:hypothetical protein